MKPPTAHARFWRKLAYHARGAGRQAVEKALWLFYRAAGARHAPKWAKRVIYGALGYFVFPLDGIPDLAPLARLYLRDDLTVMAAALATVAVYITEMTSSGRPGKKLRQWFGAGNTSAGALQE